MHTGQSLQNIILVGPPNAGKTTLFNWLTHSRFRAVNYPGSTVDCLRGQTHARYGRALGVVDSPGIYGLQAESQDEEITIRLLNYDMSMGRLDAVVVCVDSLQLERHLPLVLKLRHMGWPIVVALTMNDLARKSGVTIDVEALQKHLRLPVREIDGSTGRGVSEIVECLLKLSSRPDHPPVVQELDGVEAAREVREYLPLIRKTKQAHHAPAERTAKLDRWLLHPFWGALLFLIAMAGLFTAVFWLATPLMDLVDAGFAATANFIHAEFGANLVTDFLADGVVASFGAVLVFVPQILILFFLMGLLEDSGYLARAATLIDRPLSFLGMSGRAFVPLLSGYACAVPAIMAVRAIRSPRERWLAISVIPLLSCSARLPVYALLLGYLLQGRPAWQPGLALSAIYLMSAVVSGLAVSILNKILKGARNSTFLLELPLYRKPQGWVVFRHASTRTYGYIRRAGPVIFVLALVLWFATTFPRPDSELSSSELVRQSYAGQMGQFIEPVFEPMGVDWRVGVGLISAFAAREVFVSALSLVFDVTAQDDVGLREGLLSRMHDAKFADGRQIFTAASILGLIVFFMIALQCSSTVAIAARETGSWRFALGQLLVLNVVAYFAAVFVVQIAIALGWG